MRFNPDPRPGCTLHPAAGVGDKTMSYITDGQIEPPDHDPFIELVADFYDVAAEEVTYGMLASYADDVATMKAEYESDRRNR